MKNLGISYPFSDSPIGEYLKMTLTEKERIKSNLYFLFFTKKGTVRNKPEFGCDFSKYLFQPYDNFTVNDIKNEVVSTIKANFKNLSVENIEVISEGMNMVGISFILIYNDIYLKEEEKINIVF